MMPPPDNVPAKPLPFSQTIPPTPVSPTRDLNIPSPVSPPKLTTPIPTPIQMMNTDPNDWVEYHRDGLIYFHNHKLKLSSWEPPTGFIQV
jgi:hypothetical protein